MERSIGDLVGCENGWESQEFLLRTRDSQIKGRSSSQYSLLSSFHLHSFTSSSRIDPRSFVEQLLRSLQTPSTSILESSRRRTPQTPHSRLTRPSIRRSMSRGQLRRSIDRVCFSRCTQVVECQNYEMCQNYGLWVCDLLYFLTR